MRNCNIDELSAKMAQEIVVAMAPSFQLPIDSKSGKDIAEFYSEIFNGIAETLGNSKLDPNNKFNE